MPTNNTFRPGATRSCRRSRAHEVGAAPRRASLEPPARTGFILRGRGALMNWLFKEEPDNYSYDDLVRDGKTTWTGVRNPLAQKHLRSVAKGDRIFFYHTGSQKSVVGVMKALGPAYPDPADKTGKLYAVDVAPVQKLAGPVTLAAIKAD